MFGKKKDNKNSQSLIEVLKNLSADEAAEVRAFVKGEGSYADTSQTGEVKEPIEQVAKNNSAETDKGLDEEGTEVTEAIEETEVIAEETEDTENSVEADKEQTTIVDEADLVQETTEDVVSEHIPTEREEALLAENAALKEELEALRGELSKTALSTPKFQPPAAKMDSVQPRTVSTYDNLSQKYFK